jgi:hypothetical protein
VAAIQIAYQDLVYVFQVATCETLPSPLASLLENHKLVKIGRHVGADIKKIEKDFGVRGNGTLELGTFCRERRLVANASLSLAELCAAALQLRLSKSNDVRLSDWKAMPLSTTQIQYAALDAYVALAIYTKHQHDPIIGRSLPVPTEAGTCVALYPAHCLQPAAICTTLAATSTRILSERLTVTVTEVLIPAMIVDDTDRTLQEFGPVPFEVTVPIRLLKTWAEVIYRLSSHLILNATLKLFYQFKASTKPVE